MLECSLENREQRRFGANSKLVEKIKGSSEYDVAVKSLLVTCLPKWRGTINKDGILDYNGGDLLSAVNRTLTFGADMSLKGHGCTKEDGTYYSFKVQINSHYGYDEWRYDELTLTPAEQQKMKDSQSLVKGFLWNADFYDEMKLR